jgi:hypothetical protein
MIRTVVGFLGLLVLLPAVQARHKPEEQTPEQQYKALVKEVKAAERKFEKAFEEAKTSQDKQKIAQQAFTQSSKWYARFLALAENNPKDPVSVDALIWVISNNRVLKYDPQSPRSKAFHLLLRDHVKDEKMAAVCRALRGDIGFSPKDESWQLPRRVLEKNPHRSAKAQACLALAEQTESRLRQARRFRDEPELAKRYESFMGKEAVQALVKTDPEKLKKDAEVLYERAVKDFADVADAGGGTVGEKAKDRLEVLRHPIVVGKPAPEIEGEDIDGKRFKLSDYRGKVILLDFWGNW